MREVTQAEAPTRLLGQLVDAVDDVLYVIDEAGDLVYWNERLETTTGYTAAELESIDPADLLSPEAREHAPGVGEPIADLGDRTVVLDLLTADGEAIPHEFRGTTVEDPKSGAVYRCGVARDVTERLRRERELERYETIVESVSDGVYALDEDLNVSFVNDALCSMLDRSREELLGTDVRTLLGDEERGLAAEVRERTVAAGQETGQVEATIEPGDGEQRTLQARYGLLRDPEDGEFPGSAGVIRDVTEDKRRERKLARQRALLRGILNTMPDVVFAFDPEGNSLATEILLDDFLGYSADEISNIDPLALVPPDERDAMAELLTRALEEGETFSRESALLTKDGTRIPYEFRGARLTDEDGDTIGIVGTGRDITERVERERALEQRRDELETLNRINELLLDITRELVEAPDRRALERTVCERLASSSLYRFAWIGEREFDGDGLAYRVSAGADEGYVSDLTVDLDETGDEHGPATRALQTGTVQVVNVDEASFEPWRAAAEARDVRSVAAVPLRHGETVYGVLAVYATRPDAFSEREQAGFGVLGETIGFVINAVKRRTLLFADRVTELEFEVGGTPCLLSEVASGADADVELSGFVQAEDRWLAYLDVGVSSADRAREAVTAIDRVVDARVVSSGSDLVRVEVAIDGSPLLDATASVGATVAGGTGTATGARLVIQVPGEADVREAVELLVDRLPDATLVAQRELDRQPDWPGAPGGPVDALTDRQREALQVAYRAGYYAWPRESTAEEIAETLDIAPATLHAHLRKAEAGVLGDALEGA